jgi:hypothetical protein
MRIKVLTFAVSYFLILNSSSGIPQSPTTTSSPQAATLLAQSAIALTRSIAVTDVTLTGTAEWIAGSDEAGTATYKAIRSASRLDLVLSGGTRSEIRNASGDGPIGMWSDRDGTSHGMVFHNLIADPQLFPYFTIANASSAINGHLTYIGLETRNNSSVIHVAASQQYAGLAPDEAILMQHLSQIDIYLDSVTFLPVACVFNIHPDDNELIDIPTEIRYSNYQIIDGVMIPFRVQKLVNGGLNIDLKFEKAIVNSGLPATIFSVQ